MKSTTFIAAVITIWTSVSNAQLCVTQGPGSCQGVYECWTEPLADEIECEFLIYDYNCKQIGNAVDPDVGDAIDSQLPFTVDVTWRQKSIALDNVGMNWLYTGGKYGRGVTNCATGKTTVASIEDAAYSRCAFPC